MILYTHDDVMRKLIKDIEILSASLPGRFSFQFEYAKENLYSDSENYPCAQQKIMIPVDLQQKDFRKPNSHGQMGVWEGENVGITSKYIL